MGDLTPKNEVFEITEKEASGKRRLLKGAPWLRLAPLSCSNFKSHPAEKWRPLALDWSSKAIVTQGLVCPVQTTWSVSTVSKEDVPPCKLSTAQDPEAHRAAPREQ